MLALRGIRVLELAGLAPVPLVGQILADFGADVIRVSKPTAEFPDPLARGKRSIIINTSKADGRHLLRRLIWDPCKGTSVPFDVLLDPYRPGVLERLLHQDTTTTHASTTAAISELLPPHLILARVSGYGHDVGHAYARAAGHDINYLAASGVLSMLRSSDAPSSTPYAPVATADAADASAAAGGAAAQAGSAVGRSGATRPMPPSNLLADFAGGSLLAVQGILMALLQRSLAPPGAAARGQIVDASMTAGASYLATLHWQLLRMSGAQAAASAGAGVAGAPHRSAAGVADGKPLSSSPDFLFADSVVPFLQPGYAPYYDTYACRADDSCSRGASLGNPGAGSSSTFVAVGAIEGPFFVQLMHGLRTVVPWPADLGLRDTGSTGVDAGDGKAEAKALVRLQADRARWPALRAYLSATFALRPRSFWCNSTGSSSSSSSHRASSSAASSSESPSGVLSHGGIFAPEGQFGDACVTPVLLPAEALHLQRYGRLPRLDGFDHHDGAGAAGGSGAALASATAGSTRHGVPLPAPRLSRTGDRFRAAAAARAGLATTRNDSDLPADYACDVHEGSDCTATTIAERAGVAADSARAVVAAGAHTDAVLREILALSDAELSRLRGDGVVA